MPTPMTLLNMTTAPTINMPPVNPAVQQPSQAQPVATAPAITQPTQTVRTALAIPAAFGAMATLPGVDELPEASLIYGFYASSRSKNYDKCLKAGAAEGDAVISVEGNLVALKTFKYFLAAAFACRSKMENDGSISAVNLDAKTYRNETPDEHYVTLLIAFVNGKLIPVKFDFRTTKSKAAAEPIRTLHQSITPEWGNLSPQHRDTMAYQIPWGRVVTETTTQRRVSAKGLVYHETIPVSRPATPDEMKALTEFASNQDNLDLFSRVQADYEKRCEELRGKVK